MTSLSPGSGSGSGAEVRKHDTFNDWAGGSGGSDTALATMPYRNSNSGSSQSLTVYVYATTVPVDPSRTVSSITLPSIGSSVAPNVKGMHIFAVRVGG